MLYLTRALQLFTSIIAAWCAVTIGLNFNVEAAAPGREAGSHKRWTLDTPLPDRKYEVAAVRDSTGTIYVFGRDQRVEAFDPATHVWNSRAPLPVKSGLSGLPTVTAGPDGKIYATGSDLNWSSSAGARAFEAYDPSTNRWAERAPIPTGRSGATAVTGKDGKIYVLGGFIPDPGDNSNRLFRRSIDVYNPRTNSWQVKAAMPTAREGLGASVGPDGKIYAIGGGTDHFDRFFRCFATVEAYDPTTDSWSRKLSLPTQMCDVTAGLTSNGTIVAVGGATVEGGEQGPHITPATGRVLSFKPGSSRWTVLSRTPIPRKQAGGVVDPKGTVYVIGGEDRFDHPTATVQACRSCGAG